MTNNNQSLVETMQPYQRAVAIAQEVTTEQLQTLLEQEIARIEVARASADIHSSFIGTGPYTASVDPIDNSSRFIWTSTEEQQRRREEERRIMNESFRNSLLWGSSTITADSRGTVVNSIEPNSLGLWEQLREGPYINTTARLTRTDVGTYSLTDFSWPPITLKSSVDKFLDKLGILDEKQREFHKRFIRKDLEFDK